MMRIRIDGGQLTTEQLRVIADVSITYGRDTADLTEESIAETLEYLRVEAADDGYAVTTPSWFGDYLFGGFVIAQALAAIAQWAPEGRRIHSLHAYFLRPVRGGDEVNYRGGLVREGRSFATCQVEASQRATWRAATPPMEVKPPAAMRSRLEIQPSCTTIRGPVPAVP